MQLLCLQTTCNSIGRQDGKCVVKDSGENDCQCGEFLTPTGEQASTLLVSSSPLPVFLSSFPLPLLISSPSPPLLPSSSPPLLLSSSCLPLLLSSSSPPLLFLSSSLLPQSLLSVPPSRPVASTAKDRGQLGVERVGCLKAVMGRKYFGGSNREAVMKRQTPTGPNVNCLSPPQFRHRQVFRLVLQVPLQQGRHAGTGAGRAG